MRLMLATVLAVSFLAVGCAVSGSDAPASSGSGEATRSVTIEGTDGDFAGLVDIGGGREIFMECRGTGSPPSCSSPAFEARMMTGLA